MRKFNLSLDDMSPHPRAGGGFESIEWCDKLIEKYPDLKINLFVPAAYCRLGEVPYALTDHKDWLKKLKALPDNYVINMHGMYHRRVSKKYGNSNNDEWQFLTDKNAPTLACQMNTEFSLAELSGYRYPIDGSGKVQVCNRFRYTFRPPGWKISKAAVKALEEYSNITCFAGSKEYYEKVKDVLNVKWVSYNWDLTGPCATKGDVVAYGHTSDWTNNYMNKERFHLIDDLLKTEKFDFRFIEEM